MLKTISSLHGVNILSIEAQKKVVGGVAQATSACGVIFQNAQGGKFVIYNSDENNNGATKDDAIKWATDGSGIANTFGTNTGHWCCDSCKDFPSLAS